MRFSPKRAYTWVDKKLTGDESTVKEVYAKLFGDKRERSELNADQNNFVNCFVDCGHLNYYNINNIIKGKVKAFPGQTPKERLLTAIEALFEAYYDEKGRILR